ncbi:MAG TPA: hypothetical protein VGN13_12400 [Solirubrobacteraceae bacterium]
MSIKRCPAGSQIIYRFGFPSRELTDAERETLEAGLGLPSGTGIDPAVVKVEYEPNGEAVKTLEAIIRDGPGAYHAIVATPASDSAVGPWRFRGVGSTSGGAPVAATDDVVVRVTRTFG